MILASQQAPLYFPPSAPLRNGNTDEVSFVVISVASENFTRFSHAVLTFMSIFYKHVFPELEQLRLVMRYIE